MKIGFFGTPDIAARCLEDIGSVHTLSFVVTGVDKQSGRNLKVACSPVKETALSRGYSLFQPERLDSDELLESIRSRGADIFVVVAYGKIIPRTLFSMPRLGTINLHPSLLPRYRGAAPIPWALINGEPCTGITVQHINEKLDAGDILMQEEIPLTGTMTAGDLYELVIPRGSALLIETIKRLEEGTLTPRRQNEEEATYCGKIDRDLARVNWTHDPAMVHNRVRGLNPKPGAWTTFRDKTVKIWHTGIKDIPALPQGAPGQMQTSGKRLFAVTGAGHLEILSLQPEGKKVLDGTSFINGYRLSADDHFL